MILFNHKNIFSKTVFWSLLLLFFTNSFLVFSQKENIGTEVVNVVKPYTPTISDAYKVKETPTFDEDEVTKKEVVKYSIFSFPVASTFTPAKGRAASVDKRQKEPLFDNYATFGLGNYQTIIAELFVTHKLSDSEYVGAKFLHHSSFGKLDNVLLDNYFLDSKLAVAYGNQLEDMNWKANISYQNQIYNWYGLPTNFGFGLSNDNKNILLEKISPNHSYHDFGADAKVTFNESIFSEIGLLFNRFWDNYQSSENNLVLQPVFNLDFNNHGINLKTKLEYTATRFQNFYQADLNNPVITNFGNQNSYFGVSVNPNYTLLRDDLTLNLGAEFSYLNTINNVANNTNFGSDAGFYIYPKITASYKIVNDLMIGYAGAEGGLQQNSYREFVNLNPFLSPTLSILPTDLQFDIYAGLKGKLANNLSYNIRASLINEQNKSMFRKNYYFSYLNNKDYENGNSFTVVYDDVATLNFFGELKAAVSDKVTFGVNGSFSSFNSTFQDEVWNLPTIKMGLSLDFNFTQKWFAATNLFFVGERKDQVAEMSPALIAPPIYNFKTIVLPGFFDANFNLGYKYNERLTAFLRVNNLTNNQYQLWQDFAVQQLQVVLGANYKFDF